jgi:hypothetical protein
MFCVDGNLTHLPGKKLWEKSLVKSGQKEGGSGPHSATVFSRENQGINF